MSTAIAKCAMHVPLKTEESIGIAKNAAAVLKIRGNIARFVNAAQHHSLWSQNCLALLMVSAWLHN